MTQRVKSPVWAVVLLLICLILRFCDSWLFGEENKKRNFPQYQRFRPSYYRRVETNVNSKHWKQMIKGPDSLGRASYFFR